MAGLLAGDPRVSATLSLAGRTKTPRLTALDTRVGGFGGVEGLAGFLARQSIDAVVDATHPYADQMSANAVAACARERVPLATIVRPAWRALPGDCWQVVATPQSAALALGDAPRRVFLALGRQDLPAFTAAPQHRYLARVIERPDAPTLPPDLRILQARGPFDRAQEIQLLSTEKIEVVVSKNSGGGATYAKIEAARELALPLVMIARPHKATGEVMGDAQQALAWVQQRLHEPAPSSPRGV